ncbi:MAG: hypothetical protein ACLQBX_00690 [Candidatus Limnocylindrales bacterium]|jgi:molybdopterin-guanine dinucleotide biosynthesis protein A
MLHMVVQTHTAEDCAFRSDEDRRVTTDAYSRLLEIAKQHGAQVQGAWVNTASHTTFALVNAPNAHVVNAVIEASGLVARVTTTVYAVTTLEGQIEALSHTG